MDISNSHNQSYWFTLRDDQANVVFTSNNFTIQTPQIAETHYVLDTTDNRPYVEISQQHVESSESVRKDPPLTLRNDDSLWDKDKIKMLLSLSLENRFQNTNPNSKDKILWNKIALAIGISAEECCRKYRSLRKTYVRLLQRKSAVKEIRWPYYNMCEEVFKDCKVSEAWEDSKIRRLLSLYIENLSRFKNQDLIQKDIWRDIASSLGGTEYNCYHKFKALKRTYFKFLQRSQDTGTIVKWPYHHYFERIFYNYNPNVRSWDRVKTKQLLDAYAEMAHKFRDPKYQKKELWKDISNILGELPSECDRKFRNLKQTYIRFKMRVESGRQYTKWRYFKEFESIFNSQPHSDSQDPVTQRQYSLDLVENDYIKRLLTFYIENQDEFMNPLIKNKRLWKKISFKLGMTAEQCDKKFRNLKQTYRRLIDKKELAGNCIKWPYFSYFQRIYGEPIPTNNQDCNQSTYCEDITLTGVKKTVQVVQERKENDRRFEILVKVAEESNDIQRERNRLLQALLNKRAY